MVKKNEILKPMGMFITPKTVKELEKQLNGIGSKEQVQIAKLGMYFTWNYLSKAQSIIELQTYSIFAVPETIEDLHYNLDLFTGGEKTIIYQASAYTWNFVAYQQKLELKKKKSKK